MAKVLVLGAGFIGSHVAEDLVHEGYDVRVLSRTDKGWLTGDPNVDRQIEFTRADLSETEVVARAAEGTFGILHCVTTTHPGFSNADPVADVQTNLASTVALLHRLKGRYTGRLVFMSSVIVYGRPRTIPVRESHETDPLCSYGIVKLGIEKYLAMYHQLFGLDYVALRCSNTYGERHNPHSGQGVVNVFLDRVVREEPIEIWGDGTLVRDFVYVRDVAAAARAALEQPVKARVYNIAGGTGLSLNELLRLVRQTTAQDVRVVYKPARSIDAPVYVPDVSLARAELGWTARTALADGVCRTWEWTARNHRIARELTEARLLEIAL